MITEKDLDIYVVRAYAQFGSDGWGCVTLAQSTSLIYCQHVVTFAVDSMDFPGAWIEKNTALLFVRDDGSFAGSDIRKNSDTPPKLCGRIHYKDDAHREGIIEHVPDEQAMFLFSLYESRKAAAFPFAPGKLRFVDRWFSDGSSLSLVEELKARPDYSSKKRYVLHSDDCDFYMSYCGDLDTLMSQINSADFSQYDMTAGAKN